NNTTLNIYLYEFGMQDYLTSPIQYSLLCNFEKNQFSFHDINLELLYLSSLQMKYLILAEHISSTVVPELLTLSSILKITKQEEESEAWGQRQIVPILNIST